MVTEGGRHGRGSDPTGHSTLEGSKGARHRRALPRRTLDPELLVGGSPPECRAFVAVVSAAFEELPRPATTAIVRRTATTTRTKRSPASRQRRAAPHAAAEGGDVHRLVVPGVERDAGDGAEGDGLDAPAGPAGVGRDRSEERRVGKGVVARG